MHNCDDHTDNDVPTTITATTTKENGITITVTIGWQRRPTQLVISERELLFQLM